MVGDLRQDEFKVLEDGVEQTIQFFGPTSYPYNVLLLIDKSGSTQHKWEFMHRAILSFVRNVKPQDRLAIADFGEKVRMLVPWSEVRAHQASTLDSLGFDVRPAGTTEFYTSVDTVLRTEFKGFPNRRALVILTDGRDTYLYLDLVRRNRLMSISADAGFQRLLRTAREQKVPVYSVALNTDRNRETNAAGPDEYRNLQNLFIHSEVPSDYLRSVRERLEMLAEYTGGRVFFPTRIEDIVSLYEEIGRSLGASYSLGYVSTNRSLDSHYRSITVEVSRAGHRVTQSRTGYAR